MATSTQQGNDIYLRNKIMTATPAELTLLLYEGAIKFANKAIMAKTTIISIKIIPGLFHKLLSNKFIISPIFNFS